VPTSGEIVQLALPHLLEAEQAIVSFGQGCEGDPILQAPVAAEAVRKLREKTDRGTINFNSNGSMPQQIQLLCDAGVDSFRFSINSVLEKRYNAYYRPRGYCFDDVKQSLLIAKNAGCFTMINYLVSPGVSDAEEEVAALCSFVDKTGVDMIQMRNLSIDPDYYNQAMAVQNKGIGIYKLLKLLKTEFPKLQFGYYNRTKENFYPPNLENSWPIVNS
jgi:pyruvate-formate lyase-activating enzyme